MNKGAIQSVEDSEGSRTRLLSAVSELMIASGSVDVSVSDIGVAAGVNPGLIRYYFGSKEGLYRALLRSVASVALDQFSHLMALDRSPIFKLKTHIAGTINTYYRHPYLNRLVHHLQQSRDSDSAREVAVSFVNPLTALQRKLLEEGEQAGLYVKTDPMLMYFSLMGACDHLFYAKHVLHYTYGIETVTDDLRKKYIEHVTQHVLGGLLKVNAENVSKAIGGAPAAQLSAV